MFCEVVICPSARLRKLTSGIVLNHSLCFGLVNGDLINSDSQSVFLLNLSFNCTLYGFDWINRRFLKPIVKQAIFIRSKATECQRCNNGSNKYKGALQASNALSGTAIHKSALLCFNNIFIINLFECVKDQIRVHRTPSFSK